MFLPVRHFDSSGQRRSGVLLSCSSASTYGLTGSAIIGRLAQAATKGAVVAITEHLAAEVSALGILVSQGRSGLRPRRMTSWLPGIP